MAARRWAASGVVLAQPRCRRPSPRGRRAAGHRAGAGRACGRSCRWCTEAQRAVAAGGAEGGDPGAAERDGAPGGQVTVPACSLTAKSSMVSPPLTGACSGLGLITPGARRERSRRAGPRCVGRIAVPGKRLPAAVTASPGAAASASPAGAGPGTAPGPGGQELLCDRRVGVVLPGGLGQLLIGDDPGLRVRGEVRRYPSRRASGDLRVCRASGSTVLITRSAATLRAIRHRPSVPSLPSAGSTSCPAPGPAAPALRRPLVKLDAPERRHQRVRVVDQRGNQRVLRRRVVPVDRRLARLAVVMPGTRRRDLLRRAGHLPGHPADARDQLGDGVLRRHASPESSNHRPARRPGGSRSAPPPS